MPDLVSEAHAVVAIEPRVVSLNQDQAFHKRSLFIYLLVLACTWLLMGYLTQLTHSLIHELEGRERLWKKYFMMHSLYPIH